MNQEQLSDLLKARHNLSTPLQTLVAIISLSEARSGPRGSAAEVEKLLASIEATGLASKRVVLAAGDASSVANPTATRAADAGVESCQREFEHASAIMSANLEAFLAKPKWAIQLVNELATVRAVVIQYRHTVTAFRKALLPSRPFEVTSPEEDIDLAAFLETTAASFRPLAEQKGLRLLVECMGGGAKLRAHAYLLSAVLQNLVGNAVKYTDRGTVTLRCSGAENHRLRMEVVDTGIGMDTGTILHAIEPGFRGQTADVSERPGDGLGLASADDAARALNGTLSFRSSGVNGGGTTVTLELPGTSTKALAEQRECDST